MRKIISILMVAVFVLAMTGCGEISYDKITGAWTVATIDGKTVEEYAMENGYDPNQTGANWTIKEDDTMSQQTAAVSQNFLYERKSNGMELYANNDVNKKTIIMSMVYDEEADTLTYQMDLGSGTPTTIVMKKGTTQLTAATQVEQ